ncbi:hemerythrin domain-containing protein [Pseudofrankia inefficax]|uniref:Hemerythrin-like domain-containing protein n=1 Tax=Pseudofrankia inefficax (strain DSM 45817 / CECT 9037 / DDB 130130 / EuI1c) TaxID=298654 RepID=E3J8D0_PSEI1|nr:hemerythrin domain-containing protein [Pseudofrankia inefficax]ADP84464.1 hypothetical protein FraEuI1c_6485 [Pseudofrankia inefficax]
MSTDALVLLKVDHEEIRTAFERFDEASGGTSAARGAVARNIIELLTVHTYVENEVVYPEVQALLPELREEVLESHEEHHVADLLTMELAALRHDADSFTAKATVLIENVTHHIDEEEERWFPTVRERLSRAKISEIGQRLLEAKEQAPRGPVAPGAVRKTIEAYFA